MTARYLILGSGVAGIAAAEVIRRNDPAGEITVLSDDPHGYYSRPGLAYFLTGELPEAQLFPMKPSELRELGLRNVNGVAVRLEPVEHRVILADGAALTYDRLLLATGATAARSPVPGAAKHREEGITDFANCMKCHPIGREEEGKGGRGD
jgi:NADPH-dependent 2,4-dienoyl-CoA reductase/sulfur reductase-like enzyme